MKYEIRNELIAIGTKEEIDQFITFLKSKNTNTLDFNLFAPIPPRLKYTDETITKLSAVVGEYLKQKSYTIFESLDDKDKGIILEEMKTHLEEPYTRKPLEIINEYIEIWSIGKTEKEKKTCIKAYNLYKRFKLTNKVDWCEKHWNTSENAYNCENLNDIQLISDEENTTIHYKFSTANTPPTGIYRKMINKFPKLEITIEYANEAYGEEYGKLFSLLTATIERKYTPYTKYSCIQALKIWDREDLIPNIKEDENGDWFVT